jgi:hypothetical protein
MEKLKKIIKIVLIIVCLSQTAIVSFSFFSNFGNTTFWSIFYGILGINFDIVSVYLLALDKRKKAKIVAYCLVFLSIVIFGVEAYSQAPDIKIVNTEVIDNSKLINEKLDTAIDVIIQNMERNESGYGTALTKMTDSLTAVIDTKQNLINNVIEEERNLESDKRLDVFILVSKRFNINPKSLLIWFLFVRGLLLEVALVVLSNYSYKKVKIKNEKDKDENESNSNTRYHKKTTTDTTSPLYVDLERFPRFYKAMNSLEKDEQVSPNQDNPKPIIKKRKLKKKNNDHIKEKAEEFFNEESEY